MLLSQPEVFDISTFDFRVVYHVAVQSHEQLEC